jgi:hypothetical protein
MNYLDIYKDQTIFVTGGTGLLVVTFEEHLLIAVDSFVVVH